MNDDEKHLARLVLNRIVMRHQPISMQGIIRIMEPLGFDQDGWIQLQVIAVDSDFEVTADRKVVLRKIDGEERIYPCKRCGVLRTKSEGGTTFTVCEDCWDKAHPDNTVEKLGDIVTGNNTKMCSECLGFHAGMTCEQYKAMAGRSVGRERL